MDITWLGHSAFKIKTKTATIIIDPFNPSIGLPWTKQEADILLLSHDHDDHHHTAGVTASFTAEGPGEYEVNEVSIAGTRVFHDATNGQERGAVTAFTLTAENMSICHLGDLGHDLTLEQIESLQPTDILLVPVGGHYTIDGAAAAKVVSQLEPRIVIPMHYAVPGLALPEQLDDVDVFIKALGKEAPEQIPSLRITRDTLPDEMKVMLLEARK
jgi:L-ascorbate metabolism protein UlaG (beta-lactamase superfamily)